MSSHALAPGAPDFPDLAATGAVELFDSLEEVAEGESSISGDAGVEEKWIQPGAVPIAPEETPFPSASEQIKDDEITLGFKPHFITLGFKPDRYHSGSGAPRLRPSIRADQWNFIIQNKIC